MSQAQVLVERFAGIADCEVRMVEREVPERARGSRSRVDRRLRNGGKRADDGRLRTNVAPFKSAAVGFGPITDND